ncbi:MAG: oligopeptide transporter, OPT family [Candidatus Eisenbacteria bacterium]|nr:oligopeptide transporter, OPT family [Candidatus Eisenbacteria bacterium]
MNDSDADARDKTKPFVPYFPPSARVPEFTLRALILGAVIGVVFGAANAFLGLKTGTTVSASIPAAVISMAILRGVLRRGTVLENNMVQTIGSSGESLAAGVVFTIPAFIFLGIEVSQSRIFLMSVTGGLLGILFMIPLRHYLMVKEHHVLPFPEGTACANVLVAGEEGGARARHVFYGIMVGGLYRFGMAGLRLWRDVPSWNFAKLHKAGLAFEFSPILLGVGYLIGPRISAMMLSGGLLAWFVLIPLFDLIGGQSGQVIYPGTVPISQMTSDDIWEFYVRYIGAGGVAMGGVMSLVKALPTVVASARQGLSGLRASSPGRSGDRTEKDIPTSLVLLGSLVIAVLLFLLPQFGVGAVGAVIVLVVSFFFVIVSSRMVGLIGSTSQPVSGMTITALLATSVVFAAMGRTDESGLAAAVTVGAIVCIAICMSGDASQDLKTGALVGATPSKQQWGEIAAVLAVAVATGWILELLDRAYGLGSKELSAPQARLMADLVKGVMGGALPWGLLMMGGAIGLVVELLGIPALPFAIGLYLPVSTSTPIIFGGLISFAVSRFSRGALFKRREEVGTLYSSGLIAGDALMGIVIAALTVVPYELATGDKGRLVDRLALRDPAVGGWGEDVLAILLFVAVCALLSGAVFRTKTSAGNRGG